jgi:hypothetical protein
VAQQSRAGKVAAFNAGSYLWPDSLSWGKRNLVHQLRWVSKMGTFTSRRKGNN